MKIRIALFSILAVFVNNAGAAPFVTPDMIKRNGLTDEQYEMLWRQGKNPRIDIGTVRQLMFRAGRYGNVTNWLDICGKTNDFAKLSFKLQGDNFALVETNGVLAASVREWKRNAEDWKASAKEWMVAATNNAVRVERVSTALDEKRAEYIEKRDKSALPTTKAIYQAFIDAIDRIKARLKIEDGDN